MTSRNTPTEPIPESPPEPDSGLVPAGVRAEPPEWLAKVQANRRLPEIATCPQPCLAELAAEAKTSPPGREEPDGWRVAWTYAVQIPAAAAAYWVRWITAHPARLVVALPLCLLTVWLAGALPYLGPVTDWVVPPFLNPHQWF